MNAEERRLAEAREQQIPWKKWGPYLSERQWGTVREDYSDNGCIGIPNALFATAALQGDASRMFPPHSLVNFLLVY